MYILGVGLRWEYGAFFQTHHNTKYKYINLPVIYNILHRQKLYLQVFRANGANNFEPILNEISQQHSGVAGT